jgi:hypothetical protein
MNANCFSTSVTVLQCVILRVTVTVLLVLEPVYIYGRNAVTYNITNPCCACDERVGAQAMITSSMRQHKPCATARRGCRGLIRLLNSQKAQLPLSLTKTPPIGTNAQYAPLWYALWCAIGEVRNLFLEAYQQCFKNSAPKTHAQRFSKNRAI